MSIFNLFALVGGLAMFLYGMRIMGESLERLGGGKFEKILERLTNSPIKGVVLGAAITAVIQSSSATTVMVVGFVNSGIMRLSQAIGIIMGANIGTTVTSWLLSLTGIEGDSLFINLLKPANFTPILAIIGVILQMATKDEKKHNIGNILLGFSVLMFGMESMSGAVKPLANVPEFTNILTMFQNPVLGVIAGAILTAVIQSSSASVGILQALSATGSITFGAAIPIILGQNIGTCVTALISCIGANKNAKRAGMVHLYFNIIGTLVFLAGFYALNALIHFSFVDSSVNAFNIAVVHTIFNITATALLLPFNKLLEKLAMMTIRDTKQEEQVNLLDERFLITPSYAIERCVALTSDMAYIAQETFEAALKCMDKYSEKYLKIAEENEEKTDEYEDMLGTYLVKISGRDLTFRDSQKTSLLLHAIGDLEQITDSCLKIARLGEEINRKEIVFSEKASEELEIMRSAVAEILELTIDAFATGSKSTAQKVEPLEDLIDDMRIELKTRHIHRLQEGKCTVEVGFIFNDFIGSLEKISDCCLNVAVSLIQLADDSYDIHQYLSDEKESNEKYKERYNQYCKKYALPFSKSGVRAE
ncbi:MAG: Na/Pi cotransporter family protein [Clostridia bacterium]|nr:Na/Pi cotransporter family protein [Clostridia bacterium]